MKAKPRLRSMLDDETELSTATSSKQKLRQTQQQELATLHQKATQDYQQLLTLSTSALRFKKGLFKPCQDNDAEQANYQTTLNKLANLRDTCATTPVDTSKPGFLQGIKDRAREINADPISALIVEPSLRFLELAVNRIVRINGLILPIGEADRPPEAPLKLDASDLSYMAGHLAVDTLAFGGMLKAGRSLGRARAALLRSRTAESRVVGLAQQRLESSAELQSIWHQERNHLQQVLHSLKQVEYQHLNRDFVRPPACGALSTFLFNKRIQGHPCSIEQRWQHRVLTLDNGMRVFVKTEGVAVNPSTSEVMLAEIKTLDFLSSLHLRNVRFPRMLGVEFTPDKWSLYLSYLPGRSVDNYVHEAARIGESESLLKAEEAMRAVGVGLGELHTHGVRPLPPNDITASINYLREFYSELSENWGPLCPITEKELETVIRNFQNNPGPCAFAHGEPNLANFMYARPGGLSMVDFGLSLTNSPYTQPMKSSAHELAHAVMHLYSTDFPTFAKREQLRVALERGYLTTGSITPESYRFFCLYEYCDLARNNCHTVLFSPLEDYEIIARDFIGISKEKNRPFIENMPRSQASLEAAWQKEQEQVQKLIVQLQKLDEVRRANGGKLPPFYAHRNQILSPEALSIAKPINKRVTRLEKAQQEVSRLAVNESKTVDTVIHSPITAQAKSQPVGVEAHVEKEKQDIQFIINQSETIDPVVEHYTKTIVRPLLEKILSDLPERQAFILKERYGLIDGQPKTCAELAKTLGINANYISGVTQKAIQTLTRRYSKEYEANMGFAKGQRMKPYRKRELRFVYDILNDLLEQDSQTTLMTQDVSLEASVPVKKIGDERTLHSSHEVTIDDEDMDDFSGPQIERPFFR